MQHTNQATYDKFRYIFRYYIFHKEDGHCKKVNHHHHHQIYIISIG